MDPMVKMTSVGGVEIPRGHRGLRRSGEGLWAQRVGRSGRWREEMLFQLLTGRDADGS